ncbi:Crp/Fnr family transcriptional regulator [Synechococcus sp. PCC 7336]|uniref:Crp/Fnr family transcriptional regulator n=1 Tax=Synechococcus sp. PCC 7336 TaxID=195250 RepID=UPI000A061B82|nr:Crp/Fnr family transcriptional regulator [Synechococcus sp. PCC 7336]
MVEARVTGERWVAKRLTFGKRDLLPCDRRLAWEIESGYVRAIASSDRETIKVLGIWGPRESIGTFVSQAHACQLECLSKLEAKPISIQSLNMNALLKGYIEQTETLLGIARERHLSAKIVKLFSWLSHRFGTPLESGIRIDVPLTHQDLAEAIGASREAVTRELRVLEQSHSIEWQNRSVILLKSVF